MAAPLQVYAIQKIWRTQVVDRLGGNNATLTTDATDGFLYIPSMPGSPTGTPVTKDGLLPLVIDSTNNRLLFYSSGAWRAVGLP
jgi:hypothetical protein